MSFVVSTRVGASPAIIACILSSPSFSAPQVNIVLVIVNDETSICAAASAFFWASDSGSDESLIPFSGILSERVCATPSVFVLAVSVAEVAASFSDSSVDLEGEPKNEISMNRPILTRIANKKKSDERIRNFFMKLSIQLELVKN
jgi:hypothetical protein